MCVDLHSINEQEPERFGGSRALPLAEDLFGADSRAVADLLHGLHARAITEDLLMLAVSTVDTILDGMGLEPAARAAWARDQAGNRHETGAEYRRRKDALRALLDRGVGERPAVGRDPLTRILGDLLNAVRQVTERYAGLASAGELPLATTALCQSVIHLHLNRLLGADSATERRVLGCCGAHATRFDTRRSRRREWHHEGDRQRSAAFSAGLPRRLKSRLHARLSDVCKVFSEIRVQIGKRIEP